MTINAPTPLITYTADGIETDFPLASPFYDTADVKATLVDAAGEHAQTAPAFSVVVTGQETIAPGLKTGLVRFATAPDDGDFVSVFVWPNAGQDQKYHGVPITARQRERVVDKLAQKDAMLRELVARSYRTPISDAPGTGLGRVIGPASENHVPMWDEDGNLVPGPSVAEILAASGVAAGRALVYPEAPEDPIYDAGGRKIGNLGEGTDPDDAVTLSQLEAATGADTLTRFVVVADQTELKALVPATVPYAYLARLNYEGEYLWRAGNFVGAIAADPYNGLYAKADTVAAADGAYVRKHEGFLIPEWFGVVADNATINDDALTSAFANIGPRQTMSFSRGGTVIINGNVPIVTGQIDIQGRALIKKRTTGGDARPMFLVLDNVDDVNWSGLEFDGGKSNWGLGAPVPAILAHRASNHAFSKVRFHDFVDVGIKYRQSSGLAVDSCFFYNMGENGIECRFYENDPRTGDPWVGAEPYIFGALSVNNSRFERIGRIETTPEDSGLVDGCGVTIDCGPDTSTFMENVAITGNKFIDCLRGFFCENNEAGRFGSNMTITGNAFVGKRSTPDAYCKMGIGLINVQGWTIAGNSFKNIGNYDTTAYSSNNAGIVLSGNSRDGVITGNSILDNRTPSASTMHYGIQVTDAERVAIVGNSVHGEFIEDIYVAVGLTDISVTANMEA